jgi:hypothetical protein|tara:strand:- start:555 stop:713 length:159 start_codon:yes stop_codon:yes gene_type:complete
MKVKIPIEELVKMKIDRSNPSASAAIAAQAMNNGGNVVGATTKMYGGAMPSQ